MTEFPRVVARAVQLGFGGGVLAHLRGVGAAEDDEAGSAEPGGEFAVGLGDDTGEQATSAGGREAGDVAVELLDEEGNAGQRTPMPGGAVELGGLGTGLVEPAEHHGVEHGIALVDPVDGGVDQFARGDLARRDEFGETHRVVGVEERVDVGHGLSRYCA